MYCLQDVGSQGNNSRRFKNRPDTGLGLPPSKRVKDVGRLPTKHKSDQSAGRPAM